MSRKLESALAGRPGRIDQAIEVPLPDVSGRGKLVRLYGGSLPLDDGIAAEIVRRTEGVSAALSFARTGVSTRGPEGGFGFAA